MLGDKPSQHIHEFTTYQILIRNVGKRIGPLTIDANGLSFATPTRPTHLYLDLIWIMIIKLGRSSA